MLVFARLNHNKLDKNLENKRTLLLPFWRWVAMYSDSDREMGSKANAEHRNAGLSSSEQC